MSGRRYALVAGGGTGGHLLPAVAVAQALAAVRGADAVEVVGSRRGLEGDLLTDTGLRVTRLPGRGFSRALGPRHALANAGALAGLTWAFLLALGLVARRRPAVVVAMGGYGCVPVALAALVFGVPVVLVNLDAVPGAASRLVGHFARAAAVAFPGTGLPRAVVTGAPVRAEVVAAAHPDGATRGDARRALGLPTDRFVVAAVGGSLGSKTINRATLALAGLWVGRADVAVYHVVGRRDMTWIGEGPESAPDGLVYRQVPFEERMGLLYQAADVVVSRAGASTVCELAVVGVPAVLVPLPGAPGDHQTANATVLVAAGGAVMVSDAECTGARLAAELDGLRSTPERLEEMRAGAASVGRPQAVAAVVDVVESHARAGPGPDRSADAGTRARHGVREDR
ncbi:MAG TPA: UDP-N-acetylglucosamine--N-acetylmuramyl-(pentapeptide) pyrophosphoryl-undecaprenol N-acetylglucosamine transferase [Acidimicrobiales bacterium]|nr:UDP-N-acetylglucosamine--N-acetylmuramyl-(pentapeptide) pyrophosphoryl-undecaprenol N-acetylglucosamine transferase [Acidimicrobiales bacterium]